MCSTIITASVQENGRIEREWISVEPSKSAIKIRTEKKEQREDRKSSLKDFTLDLKQAENEEKRESKTDTWSYRNATIWSASMICSSTWRRSWIRTSTIQTWTRTICWWPTRFDLLFWLTTAHVAAGSVPVTRILFVNYDCDPYALNILDDLLILMSKNCFLNSKLTNIQSTGDLFEVPLFSFVKKKSSICCCSF